METNNVCRCCLAQGPHKDLNLTYIWMDEKEIYSEMLLECFNITLSPENASNNICECCVETLRNSLAFKRQVLQSEQQLFNRLKEDENHPEVKVEPLIDSENDSDGDFSIDAVIKNEPIERTGKRNGQKKKNGKQLKIPTKPPDGDWKVNKIKSLVSKFVTGIDSTEFPELTVKKSSIKDSLKSKSHKILIKKEHKEKINVIWSSKTNDKTKHRDNLQNILKFSNATPFKNKSLLGYICGYCDATFPDPTNLRSHTEVDHKKERLNFKTTFDMTEYNVNLDITDLNCTLCDVRMENLSVLREHLVKSHQKFFYDDIKDHVLQFKLEKGEVYNCTMCTSTYETFKMLKQHMNKHYCNYMCNICDSSFATKRSLNAHKTTHLEGSFKCDYCDKVFSSRPKKHYHEKTKHLGARSISNCPYCDEPFRSYYQRNQHLIKVHNSEAKYKCNICDKTYILKSLLMYHIKKCHLMERNFQCTECGYRFFSKKALKAHMVKHTGERNYHCEVCNKSYARKYTLREHMRIHNNDRRFKCSVCGTSFVQKCSLKSHLLSNHGISMSAGDITSSV